MAFESLWCRGISYIQVVKHLPSASN
jgi:hypothetical protein